MVFLKGIFDGTGSAVWILLEAETCIYTVFLVTFLCFQHCLQFDFLSNIQFTAMILRCSDTCFFLDIHYDPDV